MPTNIETAEKFNEIIREPHLTVIHFSAPWIDQCDQVDKLLDTLAEHKDYGNVKFYKCVAEDLSDISHANNIVAAPTVLLFTSSKVIDRIDGVNPSQITAKITQHLKPSETIKEKKSLDERLKLLINKSKVMLFMKGDRKTPKCGFSRQIVGILNDIGTEYETFDILTDEEVRQGLKVYSDWPTYPQLYVDGELIGGLDIVKEMQTSGELTSTLGK